MGSSFDSPGFFTRNIEDMKLVESIIEGRDIHDATTSNSNHYSKSNKVKTIGVPKEFLEGLDGDIRESLENKITLLKNSGFDVKDVSIPSTKYGLAVYYILVPSEISSNRARYDGVRFGAKVSDNYEKNMIEMRTQYFEDEVKRRIMIGTYSLSKGYSEQFYKQASKVRTKLKKEFDEVLNQVDVLLAPVSPTTAFKLGEKSQDPVKMYLVDIYTVTANIVGIPSLSVPAGQDSKGLPIGLQIMSKKFEEEKLYSLSQSLT
jgi:aspartyl-tRNA(Asn)/glutamyl-tRNA(Gln) amidotransferase subunit A